MILALTIRALGGGCTAPLPFADGDGTAGGPSPFMDGSFLVLLGRQGNVPSRTVANAFSFSSRGSGVTPGIESSDFLRRLRFTCDFTSSRVSCNSAGALAKA